MCVRDSYTPSASNNYQLDITINSESRFDLDGDGNTDTIYYSVLSNPSATNGIYTETLSASLTINGTELLHPEQNNSTADYGLWLENPDVEYYYIVDLDVNDSYRELAIGDCGSDGETCTHYFRYQQGELIYLGRISGLPDDHTTLFHGDGTVSAMTVSYTHLDVYKRQVVPREEIIRVSTREKEEVSKFWARMGRVSSTADRQKAGVPK